MPTHRTVAIRSASPGPLFILADGTHLTRHRLVIMLDSVLQKAGFDSKKYATHSIRIGAATSAKNAGISDVHVKMLGR